MGFICIFVQILIILFLGPIPDGADAVVQVEDTRKVKDSLVERVKISVQTRKGVDIRPVVWF